VHESVIHLLPPATCSARTIAILLHVYCAIYDAPLTPLLYAIHHTILAITISCKGQPPPPPPLRRHGSAQRAHNQSICLCVSCVGRTPCVGRSVCVSGALCVGALCVGRSLVGPSPPVSDPFHVDIRSRDSSRSGARSHGQSTSSKTHEHTRNHIPAPPHGQHTLRLGLHTRLPGSILYVEMATQGGGTIHCAILIAKYNGGME